VVPWDARTIERDLAGRVMSETNALGEFTYTYDGASNRQRHNRRVARFERDFDLRRITNEVTQSRDDIFTSL
jgi:YD repeat-containing protein